MYYKKGNALPRWIVIWLIFSIVVVTWDTGFLFTRPASFPGGSLAWIWIPYAKYMTIDTSYADLDNHFLIAQQIMNLVEIAIGLMALYLNQINKKNAALLCAFSSLLLTGSKTFLIFLLEAISGLEHVGHNSLHDLIVLYLVPNSLWLIIPCAGVFFLGRSLISPR
jgi:hypothetical protein